MRIIVVLSSLYTGGAEFSTLSFYGWLTQKGYSVKLVCYKKATPSYDPAQFGFSELEYVNGKSFLQRVRSLNSIIGGYKPQLVHSVLFEANLLTRVSSITNRNFIHLESLVNEMYSSHRLADPNITRIKLEGYRLLDWVTQRWGVDHFHANGVAVANHYSIKLGISKDRITIIPRGRKPNSFLNDIDNRVKVRDELKTGNRLLLINVARHEYQKGQDVLLEALSTLNIMKDKIQVVFVGREGKLTKWMEAKIQQDQLESCVSIVGHRTDVPSLLAASDVFLFPSRFEGLPGALIEAEAAGLPIIASDIDNNREVAVESRNAFFFPVGDSESLAHQIRTLLANPVLIKTMGKESIALYQEKFSLDEIHRRMAALLEKQIAAS